MDKEGYSEYGYRGTHELQQAKDEIKRLEKWFPAAFRLATSTARAVMAELPCGRLDRVVGPVGT